MFWALTYRSWRETRWRLIVVLGFMAILVAVLSLSRTPANGVAVMAGGFTVWSCPLFAGTGITGRRPFRSSGLTLFTASLPVSRFQLLAVRACFGWLEMAGGIAILCSAIWLVCPAAKAEGAVPLQYAGSLMVCASAFYALFVLSATVLDIRSQIVGSYITFAGLGWLSVHSPLPVSLDIFRAMGEGSPLIAHAMPWGAMGFSLGLAAILFLAALKVVQIREY